MVIDDEFASHVIQCGEMINIPDEIKHVCKIYQEMSNGYKNKALKMLIGWLNSAYSFYRVFESEECCVIAGAFEDYYSYIHRHYDNDSELSDDSKENLNNEFQAYALDNIVNYSFQNKELKFVKNHKGITNLRIEKKYISFQYVD